MGCLPGGWAVNSWVTLGDWMQEGSPGSSGSQGRGVPGSRDTTNQHPEQDWSWWMKSSDGCLHPQLWKWGQGWNQTRGAAGGLSEGYGGRQQGQSSAGCWHSWRLPLRGPLRGGSVPRPVGGGGDGGTAAPEETGCLQASQQQASAHQGTHCDFLYCWRGGDEACSCTGVCREAWTPSGSLTVVMGRGEDRHWGSRLNEANLACKLHQNILWKGTLNVSLNLWIKKNIAVWRMHVNSMDI